MYKYTDTYINVYIYIYYFLNLNRINLERSTLGEAVIIVINGSKIPLIIITYIYYIVRSDNSNSMLNEKKK